MSRVAWQFKALGEAHEELVDMMRAMAWSDRRSNVMQADHARVDTEWMKAAKESSFSRPPPA